MANRKDAQYQAYYQRNENQNKISYRTCSEWPSSKKLQTINTGEGVDKREPFNTVGGNVN